MSDTDKFFSRANELLERLEKHLPADNSFLQLNEATANRWRRENGRARLQAVKQLSQIRLDDLQCLDRQINIISQNTRQFLNGLPANNVLLWGPRGTGKSSLIKAILNEYADDGLRLIEVESQHLVDLPDISELLYEAKGRFIIYCDDLSFESNDASYKALKVILDGSVSDTPDNILIYATSNRRHLMPEYMSENQQSQMIEGELHMSEAIEEKISLSERFGLWLSFHPFNQSQYLSIVDHWINKLNAGDDNEDLMHKAALKWALEHGSRSGRVAWQFARDWAGKKQLAQL
ncbi:MAG: putative AAA+ superfamily ATPase [Gammaproteobacteria bacterium]|jgi:predicted AAA+ superfamily ATPase